LEKITGVPCRSQTYWNNRLGIERRPNYAFIDMPLEEVKTRHEDAFEGRNGGTLKRLPDYRKKPAWVTSQRTGRRKKITGAIHASFEQGSVGDCRKVLFETNWETEIADRRGYKSPEHFTLRRVNETWNTWSWVIDSQAMLSALA
jgi:hypothetical protein